MYKVKNNRIWGLKLFDIQLINKLFPFYFIKHNNIKGQLFENFYL